MIEFSAKALNIKILHSHDIHKCVNNSKVTGHHAIIPTINISRADISSLPTGEKNILMLIVMRLICASAPAHKYRSIKITAECGGYSFTATEKSILENGWKDYANPDGKEHPVPDFQRGTNLSDCSKKERTSHKPSRAVHRKILCFPLWSHQGAGKL